MVRQDSGYVRNLFDSLFGIRFSRKYSARVIQICVFILICGALATAGFFGYRWYVASRERSAQKVFSQYITEFNKAGTQAQELERVSQLFKDGYRQHKNSYLAPYFKAYQAEIIRKQGNAQEALVLMQEVVQELSTKSPVYHSFNLKYALMLIDAGNENVEKGISILKELAQDIHNLTRDAAAFYLGRYYWVQNDLIEAKRIWQQLIEEQRAQTLMPSPWVQEAEEKLKLLV